VAHGALLGAEVKSLWSISAGLHTRYKGRDKGAHSGDAKQILKHGRVRSTPRNSGV